MSKLEKVLLGLGLTALAGLIALLIYVIVDFKNDYDCSTTYDIGWYMEHNCERYERRDYGK